MDLALVDEGADGWEPLHMTDARFPDNPPRGLATLHRWYLFNAMAVGLTFAFGLALPYDNALASAGFVLTVGAVGLASFRLKCRRCGWPARKKRTKGLTSWMAAEPPNRCVNCGASLSQW